MGRIILAEERLEKYIDNLFKTETWSIGLIVGQQTASRDFAVHMVRTPPEETEEDNEPEMDDDDEAEVRAQKPERTLQDLDDVWVITHAKQALKMLPGGLDIIGIFAMAPPAQMSAMQSKLKTILCSIHKMTSKVAGGPWTKSNDDVIDKTLLHICPATRKLTCRVFDMTDNTGSSKPGDWKYQSHLDRWISVATSVSINITCHVPVDIMSQSILKQIQRGVSDYCTSVWEAVVTLNNRVYAPEALVAPPSGGGEGKKGRKHVTQHNPAQQRELYAEIYAQKKNSSPVVKTIDSGGLMVIKGTMCCRAFLNNKATFKDATNAIKRDVIRSLLSRCELMCDDISSNEEEQYPKMLMETPQRMFARLADSPVCFCDYAFPDEKLFETRERFRDLIELHVKEEDIDTASESQPTTEDLAEAEKIPVRPEVALLRKSTSMARGVIGVVTGSVVAALAAAISYLYLGDQ